jgi:Tfp pilus assembly protein PilF
VENAGLSALQLSNFDKALHYFKLLENPRLHSNRGVFLQALTFMKRSQEGDKQVAEQLLKRVRDENLEGKEKAEEWLKKL